MNPAQPSKRSVVQRQEQEREYVLVYRASQIDRLMNILLECPAKQVLDIILDTQQQVAIANQGPVEGVPGTQQSKGNGKVPDDQEPALESDTQ